MTATLEERAVSNPWGICADALLFEARGEPVPQDLQDAVSLAAMLLTGIALREAGATVEKLEELFVEREWSVRLAYSPETDDFSCSIEWDDGEECAVNGRPDQ